MFSAVRASATGLPREPGSRGRVCRIVIAKLPPHRPSVWSSGLVEQPEPVADPRAHTEAQNRKDDQYHDARLGLPRVPGRE